MVRSIIVVLLASSLFACGGASQSEAKGPETNPWSDYKGTYATTAAPSPKAAKTEVASAEAPKQAPVEEKVEEAPAPTPAPAPAKKAKATAKRKK